MFIVFLLTYEINFILCSYKENGLKISDPGLEMVSSLVYEPIGLDKVTLLCIGYILF